jgi:hypothetical protein
MRKGCDGGLIDFERCSWGDPSQKDKMFVVGDSMSWAIGDAFINSGIQIGMRVNSLTRNGCSATVSNFDQQSPCGQWRKNVTSIGTPESLQN